MAEAQEEAHHARDVHLRAGDVGSLHELDHSCHGAANNSASALTQRAKRSKALSFNRSSDQAGLQAKLLKVASLEVGNGRKLDKRIVSQAGSDSQRRRPGSAPWHLPATSASRLEA